MDIGFTDFTGYPIACIIHAMRLEAEARKIDLYSSDFQNNRKLFLDIGVPAERIRTVSPWLIATTDPPEFRGIKVDYKIGKNIPDQLSPNIKY